MSLDEAEPSTSSTNIYCGNQTFTKERRSLVLDGNRIHRLSTAGQTFRDLQEIVARGSELESLGIFLPSSRTLTRLDLSRNRLTNVTEIAQFRNLIDLNLSHNLIEFFPSFSNDRLRNVNLSHNELTDIPDMHKLMGLQSLDLSHNRISSLNEATKCLPEQIKELFLSSNSIDDLCQFSLLSFLQLTTISVEGNPCLDDIDFDYRPYLFCALCGEFSGRFRVIDGQELTDDEKIKGEWMYVQGKGRKFPPGEQSALISYLKRECPTVQSPFRSKQERVLHKVLEKRREYCRKEEEDTEGDELSIHSPYMQWNRRREKENSNPLDTESSCNRTPPSTFRTSSSIPLLETQLLSGSCESVTSNSTVVLSRRSPLRSVSTASTIQTLAEPISFMGMGMKGEGICVTPIGRNDRRSVNEERTPSQVDIMRSGSEGRRVFHQHSHSKLPLTKPRASRVVAIKKPAISTNGASTPVIEATRSVNVREERIVEITSSKDESEEWREKQRTPESRSTNNISVMARDKQYEDTEGLMDRVGSLESALSELVIQNRNLTQLNEQLTETLVEMHHSFQEKINALQCSLEKAINKDVSPMPTPDCLVAMPTEQGTVRLKWILPQVKGYRIFVDGSCVGEVRGMGGEALVTDLDPGTHTLQLAAVGLDGRLSEKSRECQVNVNESEGTTQNTVENGAQ